MESFGKKTLNESVAIFSQYAFVWFVLGIVTSYDDLFEAQPNNNSKKDR